MFDLIGGIPVHPLVVHAVVVLLPMAVAGTLAIVLRPAWRLRYGPLVVAAAALSVLLIPVATASGESLEERVGEPGKHAELGEQLIWFALALLLASCSIVYLEWRRERDQSPSSGPLRAIVAGVAVLAALAAAAQVYRVGDSGAHAAWDDVPAAES